MREEEETMLDHAVAKLLNEQVNKEFYSAYLYLDFSNYYSAKGLNGFANWYRVQAREEQDHALMIYDYLLENNAPVTLDAIAAPDKKFEDFAQPLHAALAHEEYVTSLIHRIYASAADVKDYRTMKFLDWFVAEQGEEEKNTHELISRMDLFGGKPESLYMLDKDLAARTYSAPAVSAD